MLNRPPPSQIKDGVLIAEVVKHMFPRLVDVHNYAPANSNKQKMQNWTVLNNKVFRKLRFELSNNVMEKIVDAQPGIIECILSMLRTRLQRVQWDQKNQKRSKMRENERPEVDQHSLGTISSLRGHANMTGYRGGVTFGNSSNNSGGGGMLAGSTSNKRSSKFPQDETVPLILLEEKEQELLMKDETILILQAKIKRLEHLLHLKDIRIEELQTQLETTRQTGTKR
ncbi:hypothetical protein ACOMHN_060175 [Nucella lapillus]